MAETREAPPEAKFDRQRLNPIVADSLKAFETWAGVTPDVPDADHTYVTLRVRFDDLEAIAKAATGPDEVFHEDCTPTEDYETAKEERNDAEAEAREQSKEANRLQDEVTNLKAQLAKACTLGHCKNAGLR